MELLLVVLFFILGTITASFVGVLVARLNTGQGIIAGRSRCDACGATLSALSLVPVVSYVLTRGRALCCGARLSPFHPLSELLLGCFYALSYLTLGLSGALAGQLAALALLLGLVFYDAMHQILPLPLLFAFVAVSAATGSLRYPDFFSSVVPSALVLGGVLLLIHYVSRGRAMGFSDAPLTFGLALLTGPVAISGFIFSFWIGAVIGIVVLLRRPRGSRIGIEVPFAPYLAAGFILAHFTQWNPFPIALFLAAFS